MLPHLSRGRAASAVCAGHRQNPMQKERIAPAVTYLLCLNTCAHSPCIFLCTCIKSQVLRFCIYSPPPFPPTPTRRCWSLYLVKESVLPKPEHHHVRPVSSPKGSKKVLNGKRWREKSVQNRVKKGKKVSQHGYVPLPLTAIRSDPRGGSFKAVPFQCQCKLGWH